MQFSECFKQTNQSCAFSPDGKYLANVLQTRLVIRRCSMTSHDDDVIRFTCMDAINHIDWSPDSHYVLCALHKKGVVQIWNIEDPGWTCKLTNGTLGLIASRWAPDSRHVLTTSDFKLRTTVWSLINKSASYIERPKFSCKGLTFTRDGKYMAVGERRECRDYISIFLCDGWEMVNRFEVDTNDMVEVKFSPSRHMLAISDSKVEYKVVVYSLDGRLMFSYAADDIALLGVKTVAWCPNTEYLFIGSYDQIVRVLNTLIWKPVCEMAHVAKVAKPGVLVYEEKEDENQGFYRNGHGEDSNSTADRFLIHEEPIQLPFIRPDPERPNPKLGVGAICCCHDSSYMATKNDNMATVLWIWNLKKMELDTVLVFKNNVKSFSWRPKSNHLAICTGSEVFYIWSPFGCLTTEVPGLDGVLNLRWHSSGHQLLLVSKDQMSICYLNDIEPSYEYDSDEEEVVASNGFESQFSRHSSTESLKDEFVRDEGVSFDVPEAIPE